MTEPTGPEPGSFDWLLPKVEHEFQIPLPKPENGVEQTLRVVITARATVSPSYGWGVFIVLWAAIVVGLLAAIALYTGTAHGAETWDDWRTRQWGVQRPGETTTYQPYQRPDGTIGRCAVWQWRNEPVMKCD